jgi:membrane peptidoglycan carboxypeptidase
MEKRAKHGLKEADKVLQKRVSLNTNLEPDSPLSPEGKLAKFFEHFEWQRFRSYWLSLKGLKTMATMLVVFLISFVIFSVILILNLLKNLPAIQSLYGKNLKGSIQYYDRTGKVLLWTDFNGINRSPVSASQMSPYIREATVAIEDKYFYKEGPIDFGGILRSAVHDILHPSGQLEGASTITQQLVKLNEGWLGRVTVWRKIKEIYLSYDVSRHYSKSTILTGYLNIVPYGGPDYGIQAAAEDYFHTSAAKLSLAQAAMLAAIPQSPAYYSPRSPDYSQQALIGRKNYILKVMQQQGYISTAQENQAINTNVLAEVKPPVGVYSNIIAPYFDLAAKQQLQAQFGSQTANEGGWKVITTLNIPQQNEAQKLVASNLSNVTNDGGDEEATVVENAPTGQVTALVGGVNFYNKTDGQINYATIRINPGSTYKLYDYTALINDNNNVGSGSVLFDSQEPLPGYPCTNKALPNNGGNCLYDYDYQYPGPLPLAYALAGSRNVPAVKSALINGESKTIALSQAMGLTSGYNCYANAARTIKTTCYGSAAIGEGGYLKLDQSVNGYATDARLGNYVPQTFILKVTNASGQVLYQWHQPKVDQVVKPDAAYIVDSMLDNPSASYLPGYCNATNCTPISSFGWKFQRTNGWDVAVKTGTTHSDFTGLMMAMTSQYVVGSWVGYHTATKTLIPHYGGLEGLTEPLTRGMIEYLTKNQTPINWQAPPGIKVLPAYVINHPPAKVLGYYYGWQYPSPSTGLYPSWYTGSVNSSTPTCDVLAFSIDSFYNSSIPITGPNCSSKNSQTNTNQSSESITINNIACDVVNQNNNCQISVSISFGVTTSGKGSGGGNDGTITILDNNQTNQIFSIPIGTSSPYNTILSVNNLAIGSTVVAQFTNSQNQKTTSNSVQINQ